MRSQARPEPRKGLGLCIRLRLSVSTTHSRLMNEQRDSETPRSILPHNIQSIFLQKEQISTVLIKKKPRIYVMVSFSAPRSYADGFS